MPDPMLQILCVIVDRGYGSKVCRLLGRHGLNLQYVALAHGTAHSVFVDYLGLAEPEKELVLALTSRSATAGIFEALRQGLDLDVPGRGIAFALPLSGITKTALDKSPKEKEDPSVNDVLAPFELIAAVCDAGQAEAAVAAARRAGARGGTILGARSMCPEDVKKILGFTVQPEREIVLLLTQSQEKRTIMQAISDCIRQQSGEAVAFSLPVTDVAGFIR